jgi:hypothetical protein
MNCQYCFEDIVSENSIYTPSNNNFDDNNLFPICYDCVIYQKNNKVNQFISQLRKEDCLATIKRMLNSGIPLNFDDNIEYFLYPFKDEKILSSYFSIDQIEKVKEINKKLLDLLSSLEDETISEKINTILDQFF